MRERKNIAFDTPFRTCKTCNEVLPRSDFYSTVKQVWTSCKKCSIKAAQARYRIKHPDKIRRDSPLDDKRCPDCKVVKPYTEFEKNPYREGGRGPYCHECKKARNTALRLKKGSKKGEASKVAYRKTINADPFNYHVKRLLKGAIDRATAFDLPFDLDLEHIKTLMVEVCPVLGIPINYTGYSTRQTDNSPSLDRFDSKLGYVKGNVAVISWRANRLKSDATPEEAMCIALWMQSVRINKKPQLKVV